MLYPDCEYHKSVIDLFLSDTLPHYGNCPPVWAGILHQPEEDGKKQHYHFAVRFAVPVSRSAVCSALGLIVPHGTNTDSNEDKPDLSAITVCTGKFAQFLLYLTHKNAPDKIQYTIGDLLGNTAGISLYKQAEIRYDSKNLDTQEGFQILLDWIDQQPHYISAFAFANFISQTPLFRLRNDSLIRACIYEHNKPFIEKDKK